MYTGIIFIEYISSLFAVLLDAFMIFLIIRRGEEKKSSGSRSVMIFVIALMAVCVLYFYFYYMDSVMRDYTVSGFLRCLDYLFTGWVLAAWVNVAGTLGDLPREKKVPGVLTVFLVSGILLAVAAVTSMDDYYHINSGAAARFWSVAEFFSVAVAAVISILYAVRTWGKTGLSGKKKYIVSITCLLIFFDVWNAFIDTGLYEGKSISFWQDQYFDVTGPSIFAISIITFIYVFRGAFADSFLSAGGEEKDPVSALAEECGLTKRETEVAELLYRGLGNGDIAEELNISKNTVKKHVQNIYEKTGVNSRIELSGKINEKLL